MTNTNTALKISLGCCILLLTFMILYRWVKRRSFQILKEKYFRFHVGTMRTFTLEELQNATNGFHESARIGGKVYRGELLDKSVVAVKAYDTREITIEEVIAFYQINHKNVVRLLGICSESIMSPIILVYEYISNGNLYEHIHKKYRRPHSLDMRMKAAAETAAALACLHSSISNSKPVITHKNVKATNILFDDNHMVKLSGFKFSFHKRNLMNLSMGYLDPEEPSKLTEKSDVYSFGVVLAELLTSKTAFDLGRSEAQRMLAKMFASAVEAGRLHQILDDELVKEGNIEMVEKVADLANRCMRKRREERPSMKEVAMELEGLRIMAKHPGGMPNLPRFSKETDPLVKPSGAYVIDVRGEGFDSGPSSIRTNAEKWDTVGCKN